jgi:hypothetical protein
MFVVKYNSSGSVTWAVNTGVSTNEISPAGIAVDPSGGVYVTGIFGSGTLTFGTTVLTNAGSFPTNDMFLVKYNSAGAFAWAQRAGGSDFEDAASVAADASGNIYVAGNFRSASITFGSTTLTNASTGNEDIFLTKYDGTGSVIWAKRAGGSSDEQPQSVTTDPSGNILMSGIYYGATLTLGTTTLTGAGSSDIFLVKYSSAGAVTWATGTGGTGSESAAAVATDAAGNVYLTGYFFSPSLTFGATTLVNPSAANMYLAKYDGSGSVSWAASANGGSAGGIGVAADALGNTYVTGAFSDATCSIGTFTLTNLGFSSSSEVFVAKYAAPVVVNHPPSFTGGNIQSLSVCQGATSSINTLLAASDSDAGQTETWTPLTLPAHGTLTASYSATSTGGTLTPAGLTYMAGPVYTGSDSFSVSVSDGIASDTILIVVTVAPPPSAGAITGADSVCQADTIHLSDAVTGGSWHTSNLLVANVGAGGVVTGLSPGTAIIRYIVSNACGADTALHTVVVKSFAACATVCCLEPVNQFGVYPNPAAGFVTIRLPEASGDKEITITDISGKVIQSKVISGAASLKQTFSLQDTAPGNYIIKVVTDSEVHREKLIVK